MGNVLRVLGIIAISMVMGLVALFLLLFTICGGFQSAGPEEGVLVVVCVAVILGGVAAIVWLGRGLTRAHAGPRVGLAVPPAGSPAAYPAAAPGAIQSMPAAAPRPRLKGQEYQWLVLLRIALAGYAFMTFGSTAIGYVSMMQVSTAGFALPMFAGAVIGMAPFILVLILLKDPPSAVVLDLAAGIAAGSIVFRIFWWLFMSLTWQAGSGANVMPAMIGRIVLFSAAEAGIVALALLLRKSIDSGNWGRLVAIGLGFAVWEWISQTMVSLLYRLAY